MSADDVSPLTSSFHDSLSLSLECPVCMVIFKDPKQLYCGHTFCAECIDKLVAMGSTAVSAPGPRLGLGGLLFGTTISCPQCRRQTSVPKDGLTTNFLVKEMVSKMAEIGLKQEMLISCLGCSSRFACSKIFLCSTCAYNANVAGTSSSSSGNFFLCSFCAITSHQGHNVKLCSDFASREDSARASGILINMSNLTKGHIERLEQEQAEIASLMEQTKFILSREFQQFQNLIDSAQNPKLAPLKSQLDEQVKRGQELNSKFREAALAVSDSRQKVVDKLSLLNKKLEKILTSTEWMSRRFPAIARRCGCKGRCLTQPTRSDQEPARRRHFLIGTVQNGNRL